MNSKRNKQHVDISSVEHGVQTARSFFVNHQYNEAFDVFDQLIDTYPDFSTQLLATLNDLYKNLPTSNRYTMYQSRFFDFNIKPGDRVLDIGSGNVPFPFATHLADISISDDSYGRAGCPFKILNGKEVYECDIENLPFQNDEFDFVYCSHVLEHVENPDKACRELMRVSKRGFIETPTWAKDFMFDTAKVSNHKWGVECEGSTLIFREYSQKQIDGLGCDLLRSMSCSPTNDREKALNALVHLRADRFNTMLMWDRQFDYEVYRQDPVSSRIFLSFSSSNSLTINDDTVGPLRSKKVEDVLLSFVIIVLNGMPFVEYALKAIYNEAHEIVIVEGAVESCAFAANPDGSSVDGTVECIRSFPDPCRKIRLIQGKWPEKCEMQNAALSYVTGNYVWLVDSDEIYKSEDIQKIKSLIATDPGITQVNFIPDNFWKGFDYLFVHPCFFEAPAHYRRLFKYVPGSRFTSHRPPTLVWPGSEKTTEQIKLVDGTTTRKMGVYPYHYSYVFETQVQQKIELYRRYGWGGAWNIDLEEWYRECFLKWTPDNKDIIEKKYPVWTGGEKSYTVKFQGEHPKALNSLISSPKRESASEETVLPIIGDPQYMQLVLDAWQHIELDEPLLWRCQVIKECIAAGKPFWNNHVALAFLARKLHPKSYLEVGVRTGGSIVQVLGASYPEHVVAMDLWDGDYASLPNNLEYTKKQLQNFQQGSEKSFNIEYIQGNSHVELKSLIRQGRTFDLITIDGDHSHDGAREDLEDAFCLLSEQGAIVFDDIIHASFSFLLGLTHSFVSRHPELSLVLNTIQDNGCAIFLKNMTINELIQSEKKRFKVAGDYDHGQNLTKVNTESEFASAIRELFTRNRPTKIIETGTYHGEGTTKVIASTLRDLNILDATFYTIECNPGNYNIALSNLVSSRLLSFVKPLKGLSLPRHLLPTQKAIEENYVHNVEFNDIFVDHQEFDRATRYYNETNFNSVPDDLLQNCLKIFSYAPDFVLLDSGGHIGHIEFTYLLSLLKAPCFIALDDIYHVKHHKSFIQIQNDPRFKLIAVSDEKFGFCISQFIPESL